MTALLRRARRLPVVHLLLQVLAWPVSLVMDLVHLQRTRHAWEEIQDLLDREYALRQDLQGLELVKMLHDDADVRLRAEARATRLHQELARLGVVRRELQRSIRQTYDTRPGAAP